MQAHVFGDQRGISDATEGGSLLRLPVGETRDSTGITERPRVEVESLSGRLDAFRDQLRSDPADAATYVELKRSLATRFEHDSRSYTSGKHDFVKAMERKRGVLG